MIQNALNQSFEDAYAKLNAAQKDAVDTIEGPVLVIAGPGTGKTQILASRIAKILMDTDANPENILCLTYTDAGTVAMRSRLLQFIGTDAYKIHIHTFHSFCNSIIQQHQELFASRSLDMIDELGKKQLIHELIDELPTDNALKKYTGDVYSDAARMLNLFADMKKEGWTAAFLKQKVTAYLQDLPNREEFIYKRKTKTNNAGDIKQHKIDEIAEQMNRLVAAAEASEIYNAKLKTKGLYDFDDMILWVLNAIKEHPNLLIQYQEQYLYLLVDEFQDSSNTQIQLVDFLASYWPVPNVFCVGDDDQSIFRFQGANIENIKHFSDVYQPKPIRLEENYRSSQEILDYALTLISKNVNSRLSPDKKLVARNELVASLPDKPSLRMYLNPIHEMAHLCEEISQRIKDGVNPAEIAVLYRTHKQAEDMVAYFRQKNIAVQMRKSVNILEEPLIKQILLILEYINDEHKLPGSGAHLLFELLHYDCFQVNSLDLVRVSLDVYQTQRSDKNYSWREAIAKFATQKKGDLFKPDNGNIPIQKALQTIESWVKLAFNTTTLQLIERVINESGLLVKALTDVDKTWYMQLLHTFFDFAKNECARKPKTSLHDLLEVIRLMEKEKIQLSAQKIYHSNTGVQFMTIHGSKGLEFEYVYMIGCNEKFWAKNNANKSFKMPDNLYEIAPPEDETEEDRRLFFVGMTRAKRYLSISFYEQDIDNKSLDKSLFVADLETSSDLTVEQMKVDDAQIADFTAIIHTLQQPTADINLFDNEMVDELLKKYSLSVTHLNNYLRCPTAFYFNNLLRIPSPLNAAMSFGSSVHFALEHLFRKMLLAENKEFPPVDYLLGMFRFSMNLYAEAFTEKEFKRRMEYGEKILPAYYEKYVANWNKVVVVEKPYYNEVYKQVPINGKLDKLEFDGKQVTVVDYKTGKYENARKKLYGPKPEKVAEKLANNITPEHEEIHGGDYWRQAVFYKILMDSSTQNSWNMVAAIFDFVEPDPKTNNYYQSKIELNAADIEWVGNQIVTAYHGIKAKQFENGCGKEDCEWCNFKNTFYSKGKMVKEIILSEPDEDQEIT